MLRYLSFPAELRTLDGEGESGPVIEGLAVPYGLWSDALGGGEFVEMIAPGAFRESLANRDQMALWGHNALEPLGRKSARTLELWETDAGVHFRCRLGTSPAALSRAESIRRGDVSKVSFGFMVPNSRDENWNFGERPAQRTVFRGDLWEVSPVVWPAYAQTAVAARSLEVAEAGYREARAAWEAAQAVVGVEAERLEMRLRRHGLVGR